MKRNFDDWLNNFKSCIYSYNYYVNFDKVFSNVSSLRYELNLMNSLIGSRDIESDFRELVNRYPEVLKCVPILLAVRSREIFVYDKNGGKTYEFAGLNAAAFSSKNLTSNDRTLLDSYIDFMAKTGLFDLISKHLISSLIDYVTGVEVGLDSNARKNRGGHLMEDIVEEYIKETGVEYYKEMYLSDIERKLNINLSTLSNNGKVDKRFDYVVKTKSNIYAIETNFYRSSGSKLNETARSYKLLAQEAQGVPGFCFVWITDGAGWSGARNNLRETFEASEYIYSLVELENGVLNGLFNK